MLYRRRLLKGDEPRVQAILERGFDDDRHYRVLHKTRLQDAIAKRCRLPDDVFNYFRWSHFDFVVTHHHEPLFAVEFDEWQHATEPTVVRRDLLKNRLCYDAGLPLLRVTLPYVTDHGHRFSLLDFIIHRYRAWNRHEREYVRLSREYEASLDPAVEHDIEDLAVECDPYFWFNVDHPVPALAGVIERLGEAHGVFSASSPPEARRHARLLCEISTTAAPDLPAPFDSWHITAKRIVVTRPSGSVVTQGATSVAVRAWLPLRPTLADSGRWTRLPREPVWFPDLPGCFFADLAEHFATYLGYLAVERWACRFRSGDRR